MKIVGTVENIVFRNPENGYTVLGLIYNNKKLTAVGNLPEVYEGQTLELDGEFVVNKKFGEQYKVTDVKVVEPTTLPAIEKYLSSGLIYGVGPVTAKRIVDEFKEDTLAIMEFNPVKLSKVKGISKQKAIEISNAYNEMKGMQNAIMFLQSHFISTNMAIKIFNIYKERTIEVVKNNPYQLIEDVDGIGFATADKIAIKLGIDPMGENRVKAGLIYTLKTASEREGHTFLPKTMLVQNCIEILGFSESETSLVERSAEFLQIEGMVKNFPYHGEDVCMLTKYYFQEKYIAKKLYKLSYNQFDERINFIDSINHYQRLHKIQLNGEQTDAVLNSLNKGVSIITGGPGTGKTTIVRCILEMFKELHKKVLLCAPTGRASKRLTESSGMEAKTIHRALEMNPSEGEGYFHRNQDNPIDADVVVVDEMSMVDATLFYHLLKALRGTTRLVLVGDKDQLPSVGAGNVLRDLIESKKIYTTHLVNIYRQDNDSLIITNAHLINSGKMPIIDNTSKDFFYEAGKDLVTNSETIIDLVTTRLPKYFGYKPNEIQVLAPMKAGPCGIDNLNKRLQQTINPYFQGLEVGSEFTKFHIGDKIMQTVNNYEQTYVKYEENGMMQEGTGVFNGDIGYITKIEPDTHETTIRFDDGKICKYAKTDLYQIVLAYAITIHKSQGSEFDCVVIPLVPGAPIIITRNLLYTAITRAKKAVVLVGSKQILARMIHNNYTQKRYTMLKDFLVDEFSQEN
ncbi:MAG TPA: ATP-dependent RecD-like DNA helicase [Candidatus Onthoplasma faecipullorum]|nr:ATP-dependent RecD-like DNA helicase [Candidatus Onthoplasma faecipullorum]